MDYIPKILAFAGSAREGSFNKKLVKIAAAGAQKAGADVTYLDLRDLPMPLFNQDLEESLQPNEEPNAKKFKDLMRANDGFLISAPENNSSMSALFKNSIDWASRKRKGEQPHEAYAEKVCVIMSASPGALGGLRGLVEVRRVLGNIRIIVLPDQLALPNADEAFHDDGRLKDPKQQAAAEKLGERLTAFLKKLKS